MFIVHWLQPVAIDIDNSRVKDIYHRQSLAGVICPSARGLEKRPPGQRIASLLLVSNTTNNAKVHRAHWPRPPPRPLHRPSSIALRRLVGAGLELSGAREAIATKGDRSRQKVTGRDER